MLHYYQLRSLEYPAVVQQAPTIPSPPAYTSCISSSWAPHVRPSSGLPELALKSSAAESNAAASSSAGSASVNRRRSLRLSAKKASTTTGDSAADQSTEVSSVAASVEPTEGESVASAAEPAPSETVVNDDEFGADFTDDEVDVDAEV